MTRYKNILFLVVVLVLQIIGLAVQVRRPNPNGGDAPPIRLLRVWAVGLFSPPAKAVHGTGTGLRGLWSNYLDLRHVRQQNQELKEQVSRLQLEQATILEDARQGQRLQGLLAFKEHYIYTTLPVQVVGTSGTDQSRVLYVDKGSKDGIRPDMAVITPDGIVGKIKEVFGHTSQVLVISDQSSGAGVLLESTRLRGVLRGNELGQPQIINTLPDERVKPGEKVITSGGDQIFPRGLPVGTVEQVVEDSANPPYVDILIKPAANLGHLEELLVITGVSDQMPPKEQQDLAASAAEGAAVSRQRASDVLAERLPGLNDPKALASATQGLPPPSINPDLGPKLHPPPTFHADHYSPDATPKATALTPGQVVVDPKYAALPAPPAAPAAEAGKPAVKPSGDGATPVGGSEAAAPKKNIVKAPGTGAATGPVAGTGAGASGIPKPATKPKVSVAKPDGTASGTEGDTSGTPKPATKPKVPKAPAVAKPDTTAEPSTPPAASSESGAPPQ